MGKPRIDMSKRNRRKERAERHTLQLLSLLGQILRWPRTLLIEQWIRWTRIDVQVGGRRSSLIMYID